MYPDILIMFIISPRSNCDSEINMHLHVLHIVLSKIIAIRKLPHYYADSPTPSQNRIFLDFGSDKQLNSMMQGVDECGYFDQQQENEEEEEQVMVGMCTCISPLSYGCTQEYKVLSMLFIANL